MQTRKAGAKIELHIFGLKAGRRYCIETDQRILLTLTADPSGVIAFPAKSADTSPHSYTLRSAD